MLAIPAEKDLVKRKKEEETAEDSDQLAQLAY